MHSVYGARKLSVYEKVVIDALKNGPKVRNRLVVEICPNTMSVKKLQTTLNNLENEGKVVCVPKRLDKTRKWTSCYALPKHKFLLEVDLGQVANAVKYLRLELCRNPDIEEVAARIGGDPENLRTFLFIHAPELRWKPPTSEEKEKAQALRQKAWGLGAQIKYGLDDEIETSEISMDDIGRAEFLLRYKWTSVMREHIPSIPRLAGAGLSGPPSPRERDKKETMEAIQKLKRLKLK
jgi:hypothetical protein